MGCCQRIYLGFELVFEVRHHSLVLPPRELFLHVPHPRNSSPSIAWTVIPMARQELSWMHLAQPYLGWIWLHMGSSRLLWLLYVSCSQQSSAFSLQGAGVSESASSTPCLKEKLLFIWIASPWCALDLSFTFPHYYLFLAPSQDHPNWWPFSTLLPME